MKQDSIASKNAPLNGRKEFHLNFLPLGCVLIFMMATVVACKEDDELDTNSPTYLISQSENVAVPAEVDLPGSGNISVATCYAKGVQIYNAHVKPDTDPPVYEWVFVSPSADLFDEHNQHVGNHFAGPCWQLHSGDKINGQHFSSTRTKSVDASSIDWLLLRPQDGTTPTGIFSGVSETTGVAYAAVYRFTKGN